MSDESSNDPEGWSAAEFFGRWEVVGGKLGQETIPLPSTVLTLAAGSYRVESPQGRDEGRAEWRPKGEWCELDLTGHTGDHPDMKIAAIARVRGRLLQLCYAVDGSRRPWTFEVPEGVAWVTVRYRRAE